MPDSARGETRDARQSMPTDPPRVAASGRRFVEVAVEGPFRTTFNYEWGSPLGDPPAPGSRVSVPFGRGSATGWFLREVPEDEARAAAGGRELREVAYVVDRETLLTPGVLALARWVARRYLAGLGEVLSAVVPGGVRKGRRAARVRIVEAAAEPEALLAAADAEKRSKKRAEALRLLAVRRSVPASGLPGGAATVNRLVERGLARVIEALREAPAAAAGTPGAQLFHLTRDQSLAIEKVREMRARTARGEGPFGLLLEGVTGSGKTEVYLRAIAEEASAGRQSIVLVPEIALTPQTISRFAERFPRLGILHSGLTEGQRADEWRRIRAGEADVVIGARSAVFAPVPRLGLVVLDEEHEPTYKQESSPRYHARDAALERARIERTGVVLGSATPSLESYLESRRGGLLRASLPERVGGRPLPPVEVVDMRLERRETKGFPVLSRTLSRALTECLSRGEQAILFLNRRGYSTFLRCPRCGEDVRCRKCDVALVLHKGAGLRCHYCGHAEAVPAMCPACGFGKMLALGTGTERVEDEMKRAAPGARVARMDSDVMTGREDYERVLGRFASGGADVLVGTQMVAKGLDMPRVTLVGVVSADTPLHMADFRASERAFQLIAQVAGRAGRSDLGGRVVVQTALPDSLPVRAGARHDLAAFAEEELEHRRAFAYPPFTRLARVIADGPREEAVDAKMKAIALALAPTTPADDGPRGRTFVPAVNVGKEGAADSGPHLLEQPGRRDGGETGDQAGLVPSGTDAPQARAARHSILGPSEAPLGKLRGRRRQHILLKAADWETIETVLWGAEKVLRHSGSVRVTVDVDPWNMR